MFKEKNVKEILFDSSRKFSIAPLLHSINPISEKPNILGFLSKPSVLIYLVLGHRI